MSDPELDLRFAKDLNNRVWDVLDAGDIGDASIEQREALLYSAYASAHHWIESGGTLANRARAEHLISRAAALAGFADVARRHADRCVELCEANADEVTDWDLGFAHEARARALAAAGDLAAAREARAHAEELTARIADDQDRAVVEGELARPPWFGLE